GDTRRTCNGNRGQWIAESDARQVDCGGIGERERNGGRAPHQNAGGREGLGDRGRANRQRGRSGTATTTVGGTDGARCIDVIAGS
ncbi:hypothetical protein ACSTK6_00295, partial [Vibrio parahaemolyticus]